MMTYDEAARRLGGEYVSGAISAPGPGHSKVDRSLRVWLSASTPDGFSVYSQCGDDWKTCKDHVRGLLGIGTVQRKTVWGRQNDGLKTDAADRTEYALKLWHEACPIKGTPAETYLASRGLAYDGEALRWHPRCPFGRNVRRGCMVALVRNIETNEPQAIHRTAIDSDGRKIGRLTLGPIGGGAVKLTNDVEVSLCLAIGEGIETTLAIKRLPHLSDMPVWATISAGGMAAFPALKGLESVWIAADHDDSQAGQKAARRAAERLHGAGIETIVLMPAKAGADVADVVAEVAYA
jgi:putative DNA primase/helicase